jgi:hypothetical protein
MLLQQQEPYLQEVLENSWTAKGNNKCDISIHFMCSTKKESANMRLVQDLIH